MEGNEGRGGCLGGGGGGGGYACLCTEERLIIYYNYTVYVMLRRPHKTVLYNACLEYACRVVVAKKDMQYVFRNLSTTIFMH